MLVKANDGILEIVMRGSSRIQPESQGAGRRQPASGFDGRVLKLLKIVIPTITILIALCVRADAEQLLSAEDIESRIVGHSFKGKKGILSVALDYSPDGTVTMQSPLGTETGRWMISDNQLCVRLETGPRKANECVTFTREPDGAYRASNGMRLIPVE